MTLNEQKVSSKSSIEWRDIPGYEGIYRVSNDGQVMRVGSAVLKPRLKKSGYMFISTYLKSRRQNFYVHKLVAWLFIGERPNKADINHINGIKTDNRVENLEYMTRAENMRHARELGLHNNRADSHYNAKLTSEKAKEIRLLYATTDIRQYELAAQFQVTKSAISSIIRFRTWKEAG